MTDSCCSQTDGSNHGPEPSVARCPVDGSEGPRVGWTTVAALARGPVPERQEFRLCRDPRCEVVYFGSAGARLTAGDLTVHPGFKGGGDGLVCYCFLHREADVRREIAATGSTGILESIQAEVKAGRCACEVRSPSGKCCLGEVQAAIRRIQQELEVTG